MMAQVSLSLVHGLDCARSDRALVSDDEMKGIMRMMQVFKAAYPAFNGPITAEESVVAQQKVIQSIKLDQTGMFLSHKGDKEWL